MKPLAPNTLIQNRYLVVHLIGKGGMGEVYLAVDQRLGSAVALKRTYYAGDEMLGAAFEREAKILARLRHPVLPKVSDHFGENGDQYLVMEHISGDDLTSRLESAGKAFPTSWVMFWADQLLDALSYLHSHEPPIIHRDIKPQNLKLTDENHIVLLDFGLSKDSSGQTIASQPGKSGSVVGYTPHFASMEQIRGTGTDARSDIYSLSATLYQLASNTVPVDALTRADAMLGGAADPIVPLSTANPEISPAVSNVILKGLEVSRDKRFASAAEMQRALRTAHSQIQGQMSAETQVFTVGDIHNTVPPLVDPTAPIAPSEMATRTPTYNPEAPAITPNDATVQMTAADVANEPPGDKTEVMIDMSAVKAVDEFVSPETSVPAETMRIEPDVAAPSEIPEAPEFFTEANVEVPIEQEKRVIETPPPTPLASDEKQATPAKPAPYAAVAAATAAPKPDGKKGSSKAGLILGGLGGVFLFIIAGLAASWYYYTNYVNVPPSATPTPVSSPAATSTPVQTPEATPPTNGNANSNSDLASPSPTPTPIDEPTTTVPKPQTPPTGRETVPKPVKTPGPKATPKPKTGSDRTVILQ
ncbi:MAG: protein kinase [Blastocatellia bacterium]|nr:protein kinase [Blastocatellia bacterium]